MALGEPSSNAFLFVIDNQNGDQFDAFLDVVAFDGFNDMQLRYRPINQPTAKWTRLTTSNNDGDQETEIDEIAIQTTEGCDAEFDRLLAVYNEAISKAFGGSAAIPENGIERIKWLLQNATAEQDNVLTRTDGT